MHFRRARMAVAFRYLVGRSIDNKLSSITFLALFYSFISPISMTSTFALCMTKCWLTYMSKNVSTTLYSHRGPPTYAFVVCLDGDLRPHVGFNGLPIPIIACGSGEGRRGKGGGGRNLPPTGCC